MSLLTPEEVKKYLRYKKVDTIYNHIQAGRLKALKTKTGKILIKQEYLDEFLDDATGEPPICHYEKEVKTGGTIFPLKKQGSGDQLLQKIKNLRKNT